MLLPTRIAQMMVIDNLELRVRPERLVGEWEISSWTAGIYCHSSGRWIWADSHGDSAEEAIADLLDKHAVALEEACRELEDDGHDLPKAA